MTMQAFSPSGSPIIGTLEKLAGYATIQDGSFSRDSEGGIEFDHAGDTEIWWDEQKTVLRRGLTVFVDEDFEEWTEDQLTLKEADEDEDASDETEG